MWNLKVLKSLMDFLQAETVAKPKWSPNKNGRGAKMVAKQKWPPNENAAKQNGRQTKMAAKQKLSRNKMIVEQKWLWED